MLPILQEKKLDNCYCQRHFEIIKSSYVAVGRRVLVVISFTNLCNTFDLGLVPPPI